jgi:DNA-binding response OmpR family regulator
MTGEPGRERGGPGRVLVVEDDEGIAALWVEALTGVGFAVEWVGSALGLAAVLRARRPDAIVLDLGLPYRSGGALLHDLKSDPATAGIPILVVSALAETLTPERRALTAGVVAKPFSPDTLLSAVRSACGAAN